MLSAGMLFARALSTAILRREFAGRSGEPFFAARMISLLILVNSAPRCASTLPFLSLMLCHFECPDIVRLFLWFAVRDDPAGRGDSEPVRPHALVPLVVRHLQIGRAH